VPEPSFEELYSALEEKARRLEQGNLPLEDALRLYEEGAALAEKLRGILGQAELRIERLRVQLDEDRSQLREIEAAYTPDEEE
jgi:exodeoxyribonuclease VII small subunit